jgi:hypothetical protein
MIPSYHDRYFYVKKKCNVMKKCCYNKLILIGIKPLPLDEAECVKLRINVPYSLYKNNIPTNTI